MFHYLLGCCDVLSRGAGSEKIAARRKKCVFVGLSLPAMLRSCVWALAACVLVLLLPAGGSASPEGVRIVVGYTAQGFASASEVEGQLDAPR